MQLLPPCTALQRALFLPVFVFFQSAAAAETRNIYMHVTVEFNLKKMLECCIEKNDLIMNGMQ